MNGVRKTPRVRLAEGFMIPNAALAVLKIKIYPPGTKKIRGAVA
jgi:hypothetical protein